jgi:hypothetical protein
LKPTPTGTFAKFKEYFNTKNMLEQIRPYPELSQKPGTDPEKKKN